MFRLNQQPTIGQWRIVFVIAAAIYAICATFYVIFGSGERQKWDNPESDEEKHPQSKAVDNENGLTKRNIKETMNWAYLQLKLLSLNLVFIYVLSLEALFLPFL